MNRRRQKRYPVCNDVFVVLDPAEHSSKLGAMIDISMGGLSFQYIDIVDSKTTFSELDVFVSGHGIIIRQLPFIIVSSVASQKPIPLYSAITRRLGVRFGSLPDVKNVNISSFIQTYAIQDVFPDSTA